MKSRYSKWCVIGLIAYIFAFASVSVIGMYLGYPEALLVWLLLLLLGYECRKTEKDDCTDANEK